MNTVGSHYQILTYTACKSTIVIQIEMQKQDVKLLRQLMKIQTTISILNGSRDPRRRSASFISKHRPEFICTHPNVTSQEEYPTQEAPTSSSSGIRSGIRPTLHRSSTTEEPSFAGFNADCEDFDDEPMSYSFSSFSK